MQLGHNKAHKPCTVNCDETGKEPDGKVVLFRRTATSAVFAELTLTVTGLFGRGSDVRYSINESVVPASGQN